MQTFQLEATMSVSMELTVKSVYANELTTGGSFRVYGTNCSPLSPPKELSETEVVSVSCEETLYNHALLNTQPLRTS